MYVQQWLEVQLIILLMFEGENMNLIEGIQEQCNRCRELIKIYKTIPTGGFGAHFIQQAITKGEKSIASGDTVRMLSAFKELESCE